MSFVQRSAMPAMTTPVRLSGEKPDPGMDGTTTSNPASASGRVMSFKFQNLQGPPSLCMHGVDRQAVDQDVDLRQVMDRRFLRAPVERAGPVVDHTFQPAALG